MPLAMAAYRALNEVVKRSKGMPSLVEFFDLSVFHLLFPLFTNISSFSEETTHGLIVELASATDYLVKASSNISIKSVAQIYMFFITGASRSFSVRTSYSPAEVQN